MWPLLFLSVNAIIFLAFNISSLPMASHLQILPPLALLPFSLPVAFRKAVCSETCAPTYCPSVLVHTASGTRYHRIGHLAALLPLSHKPPCNIICYPGSEQSLVFPSGMPANIRASWRPSSNKTPVCDGPLSLMFPERSGKKRNNFCKVIPTFTSSLLLISSLFFFLNWPVGMVFSYVKHQLFYLNLTLITLYISQMWP